MRSYDSATATYLGARQGIVSRLLVWVTARNRTSGDAETMGLWGGDDHQEFIIDGQPRLYYGAGSLVDVPPMVFEAGLVVRSHRASLSALTPEVQLLLRGYETRLAPVEIHRALFWPEDRQLVAAPHRVFSGWIDALSIKTPASNGTARAEVTLVSAARALTIGLPLKKSNEVQKLRGGDGLRKYIAISGSIETAWGEARG